MSCLSPERLAGPLFLRGFPGTDVASPIPRKPVIAYLDQDELYPVWLADTIGPHELGEECVQLLDEDPESGLPAPGAPRGFIIRDWFGPFLLGPVSPFLRGRC